MADQEQKPRKITLKLEPGEKVLIVRRDAYYRLGDPLDDVISGHSVAEAVEVMWCSVGQKWVG